MLQTKFQYVLEKINQSNSPGVASTNAQITILISELNLWLLLQLGYFSELLDHSSTKINAYTNLTASPINIRPIESNGNRYSTGQKREQQMQTPNL
jgi:hypothetical protein